jgi:hypothetical protein
MARDMHARLDGHPGMTIFVWLISLAGLVLFLLTFRLYEWALWQRSWRVIWPDMPPSVLFLPLIILLLGSLLGRIWHGRIWSILVIGIYVLLQIKLNHPSLAVQQFAPTITATPLVLIVAVFHAILPIGVGLGLGVLALSLAWPSMQATLLIVHTALRARDHDRRLRAQRATDQRAWDHQHAHQQRMLTLQQEAWRDEAAHAQIMNAVARQHQITELQHYHQQLFGAPVDTASADPATTPARQSELHTRHVNQ